MTFGAKSLDPGMREDDAFNMFCCRLQKCNVFMACVGFVCAAGANAATQSSANFSMRADVINAGGENMASGNFRLGPSVGDTVASGNIGSSGFVIASGFRNQNIFAVPSMLNLISVFSRKIHGAAGAFDLPVDISQLVAGAVTVEPRVIGSGHNIHFRFNNAIAAAGTLVVVDGANATVNASAVFSGSDVVVSIPALADNRRVTVSLTGVAGASGSLNPPPVSMGFLVGDVNNTRSVNSSDISGVKARSGQTATVSNFKFDVNATGAVSASDISAVKARSGQVLAPEGSRHVVANKV